jgi:CDP-diacylglycerol--glycerol-3-phosphate 3-phosphatidyltransferase
MNLPILLTILRIAIIPVLVFCYMLSDSWGHQVASILFAMAAFTDWLDGYLARSMSLATRFGAFLDPVADKLVVTSALVMVVGGYYNGYLTIAAIIIVGRELVISALREWMAELGKRRSVAVSYLGKIKTACQMISLVLLLWMNIHSADWVGELGTFLLYIAAVLTLWSMCVYIKLAWPDIKAHTS